MKKTNKKFIAVLAVVALLMIGGTIVSNLNTEEKAISTSVVKIIEPTVARIDIQTTPYTEKAQFIVYRENGEDVLQESTSMPKWDARGYTLQKEGYADTFSIEANTDSNIKLILRGQWEEDSEKNIIEHWVDYTSLQVNGEEILPETMAVWHNKPFIYVLNAKAGETYQIHTKWQKHEGVTE